MSETREFTMDPNLLVSVIKAQAGTLSKAILEGVMNSIDAGASRVDVTLTEQGFSVIDDGRGFANEEEIRLWFGRFGTPHVEGDAIYGRFRMGRGQMMAFAATTWKSGEFVMQVDIDKRGLTYDLAVAQPFVKGCIIEGVLNEPMRSWTFKDTLSELRKFVAYALKPVYVNGELYGSPAADMKEHWSFEDEDAYYRVVQGSEELLVYNNGMYVQELGVWHTGMGGVVVSKSALEVNFARNAVMTDKCPVWKRIATRLEKVVMDKMVASQTLDDAERKYLARRIASFQSHAQWRTAKVLTDPSGKHVSLSKLRGFKHFVHIPDDTGLACAVHGQADTFVVTEATLNRFGVGGLNEWLAHIQSLDPELLDPYYTILEPSKLASMGLGGASDVQISALKRRELAAQKTLAVLNARLIGQLREVSTEYQAREIRVGKHKTNGFVAWTDGRSYITANKRYFKRFERGIDGVFEWLMTLVHEYCHDTDDSESHATLHGEVFFRKFHDLVTSELGLNLGTLARDGLAEYLSQLTAHQLPQPRKLRDQLRKVPKLRRR